MRIAFIDTLGLSYDGSTLSKRGLGGSESAVILISKELAKFGHDVTVFNDCTSDESNPGFYDNVWFRPLKEVEICDGYDVLIASRSVVAFAPTEFKNHFKSFVTLPDFTHIQQKSKHKVVWMHDTFCDGDDLIELYIRQGRINEIFALSDWHMSYITNCDHGTRRNFDILKNHIFLTRNGIGAKPKEWIDVTKKDPDLFVFNASVTKGMVPLVENIWPEFKRQRPQAKLKIIGGYYRFREGSQPDEQEKQWRKMVADHPEIEFTGIISQSEISDILTKASYMIYPAGFPETFGISTLEALNHNVPLITCRFGALEETAIDAACYKIDYPVEPNWSLPWLDKNYQVQEFLNCALKAYDDKYLHQQKMYACNRVKDISGWDSVALQWEQHFYHKLGLFYSIDRYRKVQKINYRVRKVFGRRFVNSEELLPQKNKEHHINIVTCVYNAQDYIENCILSVAQQDYDNYSMVIIDDCSTDDTIKIAEQTINLLPEYLQSKFEVVESTKNRGAVYNQWNYFDETKDFINIILDGDDWLVNDPQIFNKYNNLYTEGAEFTYGSCWSLADNIPLIAQEYPPEVKKNKSYRDYKFNWNMPYTHLRTFHSKLVVGLKEKDLKDEFGEWLRAGGDTAIFYGLIEAADPDKVVCVPDVVYFYNDMNPINDFRINSEEQTRTANRVLSMKSEKKFSVIMPTMWRCPELTLRQLEKLVDHPSVAEVFIIDNDTSRTPLDALKNLDLGHYKLFHRPQETNIGVNPAWNLGVADARNDLLCIMNDDIEFDTAVFDSLKGKLFPGSGPYGIKWPDPLKENFIRYEEGMNIHPWGQLFFFHKADWTDIPSELVINYGDEYIFHNQLKEKEKENPIHLINNIEISSPCSQTVNDPTVELITDELKKKEADFFWNYYAEVQEKYDNRYKAELMKTNLEYHKPKKILIAIPTARYIESETFKSIFDLEVPEGYTVDFQYFYGYRVDQVRNKIADWSIKGQYDYLFAIDHDIILPRDSLKKMLAHNVDLVSGVYRQRLEPQAIEIYSLNGTRTQYEAIADKSLVEIGGCGFGCVLVKTEVFKRIGYPQFEYHVALDHANTFSEDNDFCLKARAHGFKLYCDSSILCGHIGSSVFTVEKKQSRTLTRFEELRSMPLFPQAHKDYLKTIKSPKVIYDIGACVLHWYDAAKEIWPDATIIPFEAMEEVAELYNKNNILGYCGLLSDQDNKPIEFYKNIDNPGGNSVYRENSDAADALFPTSTKVISMTLDTIRKMGNLPQPDMIKMDVQGSELDILKGAKDTLKGCQQLILELQHKEYNVGAPLSNEVIEYVESLGFKLVCEKFCHTDVDGDYHFTRD